MHPLVRQMATEILRDHSKTYEPQTYGIFSKRRIYDVFVSFRGKDTRPTFTSHLHASLQNAAITTFKDDDDVDGLQRGERISEALLKAIGLSACSVIVLSTHYADSKWCLQELENIMACHRTKGQLVFPIFYGVHPADVRHQRKESEFGKAFESLINGKRPVEKDQVERWRAALREVGDLSGITVINTRNEAEDIKRIVEDVTRLLDKTELFVATHPVGVKSRVEKVIEKANIQQTKNVLIVGIKGMGGIGKTTIAKAIYNKIGRNFEGRSFLLNIRETWQQDNGMVYLQQRLLEDIFRATRKQIHNIDSGKQTLMESLVAKRVFVVLDDVNDSDQLNALCGSRKWFGPGSIVIITTRYDNLLRECGVDHKFEIEEMNKDESLEFFSWHAFKKAWPPEDSSFVKLSEDIVTYCDGLPLALEVLGSYLFHREIKEWQSALDTLQSIPNDKVRMILQISFDGLKNKYEKEIFLDIACFFIGMDRNDVIQILNGCGFHAETGISVLKERNLITVDNNNMLGMHDLLRDMGRAIICEQSPELEERSRLWYDKPVLKLLKNHEGADLKAVKGLSLRSPSTNLICLSKEAFKNMTNLKLLQLAGVQLNGEFKHLSRYLIWMSWHGFPLRHTPIECCLPDIISIELVNSKLQVLWKEARLLEELKILNLSHSHDLIKTPDFSYLPNLEKLLLKDCVGLSSISRNIGSLKNILHINIEGCTNLCELPRSIYKLKSLETLIISGCSKIDKLEEDVEQMESLAVLKADNTAIVQVPNGLARLRNIGHVSLCGYEGLARNVIPLIMFYLWTSPNNMLSGSSSSTVFTCANYYGPRLQIKGDVSLYPENVATCNALLGMNISQSKSSLHSLLIQMGMDNSVTELLQKTISQRLSANDEHGKFLLLGDNYPDWLTFNSNGASIIFNVPHVNGRDLKTMTMCILYSSSPYTDSLKCLKNVLIINYTKSTTTRVYKRDTLAPLEDDVWQSIISNLEPGDRVEIVVVVYGTEFVVKKTLVYLTYGESTNEENESGHIKVSHSRLAFTEVHGSSTKAVPSAQTFPVVVPSASLNFQEEPVNSGYKSTIQNREDQQLQESFFVQTEDFEPDKVEENNDKGNLKVQKSCQQLIKRSSTQKLESTSEKEINQPLSRSSDLSHPLLQNPKVGSLQVTYQQLSSSLHQTNPHVGPIPTSASTTAAITFSTAPSQPATCEDIPTMTQPTTFVPTMGAHLALDEAGESDVDLDFDINMLLSKARQVYSSDGIEVISSALDDSTAAAVQQSPCETTTLSPPKGGTLPSQLSEKVNEVLLCLSHSLEHISADSTLKDRLLNATAFLGSSTSSLPDPTTPASLKEFLENVYSFLPNLQESQKAHSQSVQALADHDIKLKKYEHAKSQLLGVLSEGKSKEKELDRKISLLEQELAKLRQHKEAVINQNLELGGNIQKIEKACAVKSSLRTSLAQSVDKTKLAKEKAERLVQGLGQRQEDLKLRLRRMLP